jgi:hypothetical protein
MENGLLGKEAKGINQQITIKIFPNADSENNNLGIGSLVYYISGDIAKQIMNVPDSERYFAIVVDAEGTQAQESTLYEGKVAYYS